MKKVNVTSQNVAVINRDQVYETVLNIDSKTTGELTQGKVIELYEKLYPCSQVSEDVRQAHVDSINARIQKEDREKEDEEVVADRSDSETNTETAIEAEKQIACPKCGAPLITRVAKKGENAGRKFYGCSAFPKCRYIQNIE